MTARAHASTEAGDGSVEARDPALAEALRRQAADRARVEALRDAEDEASMRRFVAGDASAFGEIARRHQRILYNFVLRMLRSPSAADDATQEIFLRMVKSASRWRPGMVVTKWMFVIARNHCIDELRKAKHRKTESLDRPLDGHGDTSGATLGERLSDERSLGPDRGAESVRMRARITRAIEALPEEQREVFLLREHAGLPFKSIAEITGVSENTAKSRMRYALEGLRAHLAREGVTSDDAQIEEPSR